MERPSLKFLHKMEFLSHPKLEQFRKVDTDEIVCSLRPESSGSLKTRPDGTIIDGHHRVFILIERDFDVDALPREMILKGEPDGNKHYEN